MVRLGDKYGPKPLEAACTRVLVFSLSHYKTVKGILQNATEGLNEALDFPVSGAAYQGRSRFSPTCH